MKSRSAGAIDEQFVDREIEDASSELSYLSTLRVIRTAPDFFS
jgi:hypothetical protein